MPRPYKVPDQILFEDLARVAGRQKYISRSMYRVFGRYSATTIAFRFQGWWKAIRLAAEATGSPVLRHLVSGSPRGLRESRRLTAIANQCDDLHIRRWTPAEIQAQWPTGYDITEVRKKMIRNFRGPQVPSRQI